MLLEVGFVTERKQSHRFHDFFRQVPRMARLFLQQTINFFGQRKIGIG